MSHVDSATKDSVAINLSEMPAEDVDAKLVKSLLNGDLEAFKENWKLMRPRTKIQSSKIHHIIPSNFFCNFMPLKSD